MGDVVVFSSSPGERDYTIEELKLRARALMGADRANIFAITEAGCPKPFVIGRFENPLDRRPEIYRDWRLYGQGCSWAEALALAEMRVNVKPPPPLIRGRAMRGGER